MEGQCPSAVVLEGPGGLKSWQWLSPSSECPPTVTPPSVLLAGYYAVELVNDSLYDWNVKLLK